MPARADTTARWGVDSVNPITQTFVNQITSAFGQPDFFGRYLGGTYALTSAEVTVATSNSIDLLLVDNRPIHNKATTGYFTGQQAADAAADSAHALNVPQGVGLFVDFEASTDMDWLFIEGWYDEVTQRGYVPGFYANTIPANSKFNAAYCTAVNDLSKYGNSYIWSSVRSPGRTSKANAPAYNPVTPSCAAQTVVWQYGLAGGSPPNVDTDEATTAAPLWHLVSHAVQTSVDISASPTSANPGDTVTLTSTVAPSTAPGKVQFYDGGTPLGSAVTVANGTASTSTTLAAGIHTLRSVFTPTDLSAFTTSESDPPLKYQVGPISDPTFTLGTNVIAAGQTTKVIVNGTPGDSVDVLVKGAASSQYSTLATLYPNSSGVASLIISPSTTSSYAVRNASSTTAPRSLLVKAVQSLAVKISGRTAYFTGHIAPSLVGRVVTVYYYVQGGHVMSAGSTKTTTGGQFRVTHVFPAHLAINTFAQTDADSYNAAGRSSLHTDTTGS
ncbi:MAG: hypothetical protein JWO12_248 [Frankiales bacterium]|nr:hypothetical protein [Frankiales bacterium]